MWGLRGAKVFERARRVGEIEELGIAGQQERSVSGRGHGGEAVARGDWGANLQPGRLDHPGGTRRLILVEFNDPTRPVDRDRRIARAGSVTVRGG